MIMVPRIRISKTDIFIQFIFSLVSILCSFPSYLNILPPYFIPNMTFVSFYLALKLFICKLPRYNPRETGATVKISSWLSNRSSVPRSHRPEKTILALAVGVCVPGPCDNVDTECRAASISSFINS